MTGRYTITKFSKSRNELEQIGQTTSTDRYFTQIDCLDIGPNEVVVAADVETSL